MVVSLQMERFGNIRYIHYTSLFIPYFFKIQYILNILNIYLILISLYYYIQTRLTCMLSGNVTHFPSMDI